MIYSLSRAGADMGMESEGTVSTAGLEMLRKLFPGKKRSVLELVLRRCNHDLLRAVEHFNATRVSKTAYRSNTLYLLLYQPM